MNHELFLSKPQRKFALAQILSCAFAFAWLSARAEPFLRETEVWAKSENGYVSHFVYGIGITWDDTLLVACEGRVGGGDAEEKDLLVKRSTDCGASWSAEQVIEGAADKLSWSNPTFITDGVTTYLFYSQSVSSDIGRVFYRTTVDNGQTWSERVELTDLWSNNRHGWTQHSTIGHGVKKLKEPERGRVLVAFQHRGAVARPPTERGYGNDIVALGATGWKIAGGPSVAPERGTNESRLAERADGSLVLIARQASGDSQLRARSESSDGGQTWSPWSTQADLRGTVCDSGLLRFSDTLLLYSFPASTARSAQQRQDLTIKASVDGGLTWNDGRLLHRGQATYSDLARDSRGNIYCIYGRDGANFMGDRTFVARFNAEWATGRSVTTTIVDDSDPGFSCHGAWKADSSLLGRFGESVHVANGADDASANAEWKIPVGVTGKYEVYLRWPTHAKAAPNATVKVFVRDGQMLTMETIDQRIDPGAWYFAGTFALTAADEIRVRLSQAEGGVLLADAVMLQQQ